MDVNAEIPEHFICPISQDIMSDPVVISSGVTYDRHCIEKWLFDMGEMLCPVTNLPLSRDAYLIPNLMLHRLIESWCTSHGVVRTPSIRSSKVAAINLVRDLSNPRLRLDAMKKIEFLAMENVGDMKPLMEAGVVKELLSCILAMTCPVIHGDTLFHRTCCDKKKVLAGGVENALFVLYLIRGFSWESADQFTVENDEHLFHSMLWVLDSSDSCVALKSHALCVLKFVVQKLNSGTLERLVTPEVLTRFVDFVRENDKITQPGLEAALHIMLAICPEGANRARLVKSGAVHELIELVLSQHRSDNKRTTELVLGILCQLCSRADGRAQLLSHAAGIAVVTEKILTVSPAADGRALVILGGISRFWAKGGVVREMARVGTVGKLCLLIQSGCSFVVKEKAKDILRTHFHVWKDSRCVDVTTLIRCTS